MMMVPVDVLHRVTAPWRGVAWREEGGCRPACLDMLFAVSLEWVAAWRRLVAPTALQPYTRAAAKESSTSPCHVSTRAMP